MVDTIELLADVNVAETESPKFLLLTAPLLSLETVRTA